MTHRERVRVQLERLRHRIAKLIRAEKNRDAVTATRKRIYQERRDKLGDDDPSTKRALKRYRASRALSVKIDETEAVLRKRAHKKVAFLAAHPPELDPDGDDLIEIDGKQVAEGVGREVLRIRKAGRWHGVVVSGYRTPEHSEQLCINMCGAPQCPGMCAGRATRHATKGGREGAVDLTDFITFAAECRRLGSWLENHLPRDLVHFSDIGN